MNLKKLLRGSAVLLLSGGLIVGCATESPKKSGASSAALQAISAARAANKKAKASGFEWRDTGKFIKKARAAAKKGKNAKAIKLANKAKGQAVMAVKQAQFEKTMDRSLR
ncbi:MAG TPA: SoxXA-binding protein [Gammaproteobacteria bacterium]|nr:SoxXA-binding protein [Gammaproteobacteria bacterium]